MASMANSFPRDVGDLYTCGAVEQVVGDMNMPCGGMFADLLSPSKGGLAGFAGGWAADIGGWGIWRDRGLELCKGLYAVSRALATSPSVSWVAMTSPGL